MRRRPEQPVFFTVSLLAACLLLGGCTASDDGPRAADSSSAPPEVELTTTLGKVAGYTSETDRAAALTAIGEVVGGWFDAAYVGGDYPRTDFADAWPGFTPGAARLAARDQALTSNAAIGPQIDGVDVTTEAVEVDLVGAPGTGELVGATARFRLVFATSGDLVQTEEVGGRLSLAPIAGGWQILAYDLHRGVVTEGTK